MTALSKLERIRVWAEGGWAGPFSLELSITDRCNLTCLYCANRKRSNDRSRELPLETLQELIAEAAALGVGEVRIPGSGEPMIRGADTLAIMEQIVALRLHGAMTTNGTLFTESWLERVVEMQWPNLDVSLDSADAAVHDQLRNRRGSHAKTVAALKHVASLKRVNGVQYPRVALWTVLTKKNGSNLTNLFKLAQNLDITHVYLQPVVAYHWRGRRLSVTSRSDRLKLYSELRTAQDYALSQRIHTNTSAVLTHYGFGSDPSGGSVISLGKPRSLRSSEKSCQSAAGDTRLQDLRCYLPWLQINVTAEGSLRPCSLLTAKGVPYEGGKLREVWLGKDFARYRTLFANATLPPGCQNCCLGLVIDNAALREVLGPST